MPVSGAARFALLSVAAALATMGLKLLAWKLTGSVGLLSDALESGVNLSAALFAFWALRLAVQPPDAEHAHGHGKAEYFAGGFEGAMIIAAAVAIAWAAIPRLWDPKPIVQAGPGLLISVLASGINGAVALVLRRAAARYHSAALAADADHLMSDVWTSVGVVLAVAVVAHGGWLWLDPLIALVVAVVILRTGWRVLHDAAQGLMDVSWPEAERAVLDTVLAPYRAQGLAFHALRTRRAGARRFVSMHVLVPGAWTVQRGHDLVEAVEAQVRARFAPVTVFTHLEPIEDPAAYDEDQPDR